MNSKNDFRAKAFSPSHLVLLVVLPFLSGAAALSHELLWTRRLVDLLGATDWVIGRVLGLFFLGISLGGYLATLRMGESTGIVKRLALAELSIALLAVPAAFLPFWTDWIWTSLGTERLVLWQGVLIKNLIAILVVMPPSIAMGFTLPLFIGSLTDFNSDVSSVGIWVYAINTLGGVFGLWFTSTVLMEWLGAQGTMFFAIVVNLVIATSLYLLFASYDRERNSSKSKNDSGKKPKKDVFQEDLEDAQMPSVVPAQDVSRLELLGLSFVSGFVVLALEVLLLRLISLVVPSSYHSTSALLANVILFLAMGSLLISVINSFASTRGLAGKRTFVALAMGVAALLVCFCPLILYGWTDQLMSIRYLQGLNGRTISSVAHYWFLVFGLVATCGGVALFFCGIVFPSLMTMSSAMDPKGSRIGLLFASNGIGGLAGTELANSVLIGTVGIYVAFVVLATLLGMIAIGILLRKKVRIAGALAVILIPILFLGYRYTSDLPYLTPRAIGGFDVKATHFGKEGVWLIVEKPDLKSKSIMVNNQYILGSSGASKDQRRQLIFPWLLHQKAETVCSLGLATGISASGLERLENPPAVTAVELSATVAQLAKQYFRGETNGFFDRKENRIVIEDARTYVAAANRQFDLIVGDLYRPHGTGEGRLFSLEHFQNVRRALKDDGLFCQWLPIYQLNEQNWITIAATFQKVFPETLVVYGNEDVRYPVIGLIGRKDGRKWEAKQLRACFEQAPKQVMDEYSLLSGMLVGSLKQDAFSGTRLNTLDNLEIEIAAGDFWIRKDLRRSRPVSYSSEFLMGVQLIEFNRRLAKWVDPVWRKPAFSEFQERLQEKIFRQIK